MQRHSKKNFLSEEIKDDIAFESFAAQFLDAIGFDVIEVPSEGPDGGKDMIVAEHISGILGNRIEYKWLVSCKFTVRDIAIGVSSENTSEIIAKLQQHNCNGFMAFYSTRLSTPLLTRIKAMSKTKVAQVHLFDTQFMDEMQIRTMLVSGNDKLNRVAMSFLPTFFADNLKMKTDPYEKSEEEV